MIVLALLSASLLAACGPGNEGARNTNTAANANAPAASATQTPAGTPASNSNSAVSRAADGPSKPKLNLNTASEAEFMAVIPDFGKKMAHEFEEYRPYRSIQQFRKEMSKYVDAAKIAEYERYVFVPIDENAADAPTLRQIPGLDEKEAGELIAARPYASREAFLSKLAERVSEPELAVSKFYLASR